MTSKRLSVFAIAALFFLLNPTDTNATEYVWNTVDISGRLYEIHVITDGALAGGFPGRELRWDLDKGELRDIFVKDLTTGQAVEVTRALQILALAQSWYKNPANPIYSLNASQLIAQGELVGAGRPYELLTSYYFDDDYVDSFILSGAEGLDDADDRADLYGILFFDAILQPDMMDGPGQEHRYQMLVDMTREIEEFTSALGTPIEILELARDNEVIVFNNYKNGIDVLHQNARNFFDAKYVPPDASGTPLSKLSTALGAVTTVAEISAAAARELLLQALAHERALSRIPILKQTLLDAQVEGELDPAMLDGFYQAEAEINQYIDGYYDSLDGIIVKAVIDSGDNVLRLFSFSKVLVTHFFGKAAAASYGHVALPYVLSYKTFQGIRNHADKARMASLAATLQRKLFSDNGNYGLLYHKSRFESGSNLDGLELNAFLELYQMAWYLASRHYQDTLWVLNNRLTWIWGAGIDLLSPGTPYQDAIDGIKKTLENNRAITQMIVPTAFLASTRYPLSPSDQEPEFDWLASLVRGYDPGGPTPPGIFDVGVCVTLPWDPSGTPAADGIHIRFEPRECWDPAYTEDWECGSNDPDGECTATVQLYWDDDTNPGNADCSSGASGPCPIVGAESLNPRRGAFIWEPLSDGLTRDAYYIYATITDRDQTSSDYSDGPYEFIDPIFEPDSWRVMGVEVTEDGVVTDGDGIPEVGESVSIGLLLRNESGRTLEGVEVRNLRLAGDPARHLVTDHWSSANADDLLTTYIMDNSVPVPNANNNQTVASTDEFDIYIGSRSPTSIPMIAWVEFWDDSNPVDPQYRRTQEIAFDLQVSDGSDAPFFRCDHIDLESDTDSDGVFESGERGHFTATLCNDGSWQANDVSGIFETPPTHGLWKDEDANFPDIAVGECAPSSTDFTLELGGSECGSFDLIMTVSYGDNQTQAGIACPISTTCVPLQNIRDELDLGTVAQGEVMQAAIPVNNTGSATLHLSSAVEVPGAIDTTVDSFPATIAPQTSDDIMVTIDTSSLDPGRYERLIVTTSDANNTGERNSLISFGVSSGGAAEQATVNGISDGVPADFYGSKAVYERGTNIYLLDVNTKQETSLTSTAAPEYQPRIWGSWVVFYREEPVGERNVVLIDLDTEIETQITNLADYQGRPDIYGNTIVWIDKRAGTEESDIYQYVIGEDSVNGTLLIDLGSRIAADDVRIEEDYIAYEKRHNAAPTGTDIGYFRRATSSIYSLGLQDRSFCAVGTTGPDIFQNHLAFPCDCGDPCEGYDQVYYVDMDLNSVPSRLTCTADLNDREELVMMSGRVLYELDENTKDIYEVSIGIGCQTEVPLFVNTAVEPPTIFYDLPGGDPRTGVYGFRSDESGSPQLWVVIPQSPIEVAIESFEVTLAEASQGTGVDYEIQVRNQGQDPVGEFSVLFKDDGETIHTHTITGGLIAGETELIADAWDTTGENVGLHSLTAVINPVPPGDGDALNNQREWLIDITDNDSQPPTVSGVSVSPGPGDDGDAFIEAGEQVTIQWTAIDASGIFATSVAISGQADVPGVSIGGDIYAAVLGPQVEGDVIFNVTATDDDESQETSDPVFGSFTVYATAPIVDSTDPANGTAGIDPRSVVKAWFNVDLNPASVDSDSVQLETGTGIPVPAVISYSSEEFMIQVQPSAALTPLTPYNVNIMGGVSGIQDVRGNHLQVEYQWSFTTGEDQELTPDQIVRSQVNPVNGPSGSDIIVPVEYDATSDDNTLPGIGFRVHFDSSKLTFVGYEGGMTFSQDLTAQDLAPQVDSSNFDGDPSTDKYLSSAWASLGGNWPNTTLPQLLLGMRFTISDALTDGETTNVNYSEIDSAVSHDFQGQTTVVQVGGTSCNWDVDGNGLATPLTDGMLVLRYQFGFTGATLISDVVDLDNCTRCTAPEVAEFLTSCGDALDVDGNSSELPLTDGLLAIRYLFGFTGGTLIEGVVDLDNCTRCTAPEIEAYLQSLDP